MLNVIKENPKLLDTFNSGIKKDLIGLKMLLN
jgi:hypothetical protein